jgi:hypothetical protein
MGMGRKPLCKNLLCLSLVFMSMATEVKLRLESRDRGAQDLHLDWVSKTSGPRVASREAPMGDFRF